MNESVEPFWLTLQKAGFIQDSLRIRAKLLIEEFERRKDSRE